MHQSSLEGAPGLLTCFVTISNSFHKEAQKAQVSRTYLELFVLLCGKKDFEAKLISQSLSRAFRPARVIQNPARMDRYAVSKVQE
jgi:hypothetical protein